MAASASAAGEPSRDDWKGKELWCRADHATPVRLTYVPGLGFRCLTCSTERIRNLFARTADSATDCFCRKYDRR